ncbi:MAG: bifunctional folylpolyglutamate synthase/dihydrofolate synthase [Methyloligellaceae bacterium]
MTECEISMELPQCHDRVVQRLESLGQGFSAEFNLKLERIEHLLNILGNPQNDFRIVHVGGTSGKGSVSSLISHLLYKSGKAAGLFTSPYLQVINESCQINGRRLHIGFMDALLDEIWFAVEKVDTDGKFGKPSYSEVLFALSLLAFSRKKVDVAVIEAFLGGKLDATNIVTSDVSVLVSVGLDHIEILGTTIEEIAADKVQIIKPGSQAICGFLQPEAQKIAQSFADKVGAHLEILGQHFCYRYDDVERLTIQTSLNEYKDIAVNHNGDFQGHNAACAIAAYEKIMAFNKAEEFSEILESSLKQNMLPGRNEVLSENPLVVIDGAHNPPKIKAALDSFSKKAEGKRCVIVYSGKQAFSKDDGIKGLLELRQREIFSLLSAQKPAAVIFTEFSPKGIWQADNAERLSLCYLSEHQSAPVSVVDGVKQAFNKAKQLAGNEGVVFVVGSFHLAGEVRDLYESKSQLLLEL